MELHTLQEFFTHTKGIIYLIMAATLIGMTAFWGFLTAKEDDDE